MTHIRLETLRIINIVFNIYIDVETIPGLPTSPLGEIWTSIDQTSSSTTGSKTLLPMANSKGFKTLLTYRKEH